MRTSTASRITYGPSRRRRKTVGNGMRPVLLFPFAAVTALLVAAACITNFSVWAQPGPAGEAPAFPAPANLKVLPKDLTGQQVHDLMKQWKAALGMGCNACHKEDRENLDAECFSLPNS